MARILVIDDDNVIRRVIRTMLESAGHVVLENDGSDPDWSVAKTAGELDLVITDMLMPGIDGVQVIRELRELGDPPPVLVISGGGMENSSIYLTVAKGLGAAAGLSKPFTKDQLLQRVSMLLKR